MLTSLSIQDIVLVQDLSLDLSSGLTVLTGETGAGKSILLDSLGLATGARADSGLVRSGAREGRVTACFEPSDDHPVRLMLADQGIACDSGEPVIMRRALTAEGRSRAWINDQPVSIGLMKQAGQSLVEVHGQHDDRHLVDPATHRDMLDLYGDCFPDRGQVTTSWKQYRAALADFEKAQARLTAAREEEDYLRHALAELETISPRTGEENELADERSRMMQGERITEDLADFAKSLASNSGVDSTVRGVLRRMERLDDGARQLLEAVMTSLDQASIELEEARLGLDEIRRNLDFSPAELEQTEERLFELRALARKHDCLVDDLPAVMERMAAQVEALDAGDTLLREASQARDKAWSRFKDAVLALRSSREKAAKRLDGEVIAELPPLKLAKAQFRTKIECLEEDQWNGDGGERVEFEVSTNPGSPFGGLFKIASGGEQARFILALKVVLATKGSVPVLVYDEVDRGIGGATAAAVGERLLRLSKGAQVLVVTHSPQVAALGMHHLHISKDDIEAKAANDQFVTRTDVSQLDQTGRREEIARMLSGSEITSEARAAADQLMMSE